MSSIASFTYGSQFLNVCPSITRWPSHWKNSVGVIRSSASAASAVTGLKVEPGRVLARDRAVQRREVELLRAPAGKTRVVEAFRVARGSGRRTPMGRRSGWTPGRTTAPSSRIHGHDGAAVRSPVPASPERASIPVLMASSAARWSSASMVRRTAAGRGELARGTGHSVTSLSELTRTCPIPGSPRR